MPSVVSPYLRRGESTRLVLISAVRQTITSQRVVEWDKRPAESSLRIGICRSGSRAEVLSTRCGVHTVGVMAHPAWQFCGIGEWCWPDHPLLVLAGLHLWWFGSWLFGFVGLGLGHGFSRVILLPSLPCHSLCGLWGVGATPWLRMAAAADASDGQVFVTWSGLKLSLEGADVALFLGWRDSRQSGGGDRGRCGGAALGAAKTVPASPVRPRHRALPPFRGAGIFASFFHNLGSEACLAAPRPCAPCPSPCTIWARCACRSMDWWGSPRWSWGCHTSATARCFACLSAICTSSPQGKSPVGLGHGDRAFTAGARARETAVRPVRAPVAGIRLEALVQAVSVTENVGHHRDTSTTSRTPLPFHRRLLLWVWPQQRLFGGGRGGGGSYSYVGVVLVLGGFTHHGLPGAVVLAGFDIVLIPVDHRHCAGHVSVRPAVLLVPVIPTEAHPRFHGSHDGFCVPQQQLRVNAAPGADGAALGSRLTDCIPAGILWITGTAD